MPKLGAMSTLTYDDPRSAYLAEVPAPKVSPHYEFFSTKKIVDHLLGNGFEVAKYRQIKCRSMDNAPFAKHIVWLRKQGQMPIDGLYPEVLMINSHNGATSLKFMFGFLRLVCENGLVAGSIMDTFGRLTHKDYNPFSVILNAVSTIADKATERLETVYAMNDTNLSRDQMVEFCNQATKLQPERVFKDSWELQYANREEDYGHNLWRVFNRVQENMIKGNAEIITQKGKVRKARGINGLDRNLKLNLGLWKLAEDFISKPEANEGSYALAA